ncbi:uncharacterized protein PV09_05955 [Verruconis gallopava]|uniref:DNA (cytosine-5-)-methyltransferase n=1 Tax=Verruconis gallopava TaxID=253628 RepID=A0A0D1YQN9_9PEZI|nr:uncharacterized protein PV09_05955 [Verruconis gallopava]KIW02907.1 hypothetical protein PV09_05955 [Verruconis gallopava]
MAMRGEDQAAKTCQVASPEQYHSPTREATRYEQVDEVDDSPPHEVISLLEDTDNEIYQPAKTHLSNFIDLSFAEDCEGKDPKQASRPVDVESNQEQSHRRHRMESWSELTSFVYCDNRLRRGATVELTRSDGLDERPQFLLIARVLRDPDSEEVGLSGWPLRRKIGISYFPQRINEVFLDIQTVNADRRSYYEQGLIHVPVDEVFRLRYLHVTHEGWPKFSCITRQASDPCCRLSMKDERRREWRQQIESVEDLVCRSVIIRRYATPADQRKNRMEETELRNLFEGESPLTPPSQWNLKRHLGRDSKDVKSHPQLNVPLGRPMYTYGSTFAGMGGDSEAARRVGFRIKAAVDKWLKACIAFELNHPETNMYNIDVYQFGNLEDGAIEQMDVWHFSPPCNFFSPCHTVEGKNDGSYIAALYCVESLLRKLKPRLFTLEQTSGLLTHHGVIFASLVNMIVSAGYNLRWTIARFHHYGLPSTRPRLIIFAARIGEPLPEFPKPTHGPEPGLKPFNHIWDAVSRVPPDADDHLDTVTNYAHPKMPYDPRTTFSPCITTSGPQKGGETMGYFTGERPFTIRELLVLNGFEHTYRIPEGMSRTDMMTMIGNAVPPIAWEAFIGQVYTTMKSFDSGVINEAGLLVLTPCETASSAPGDHFSESRRTILSTRPAFPPTWNAETINLTDDVEEDRREDEVVLAPRKVIIIDLTDD